LNRDAPRYSGDSDVFHDRLERVASAAIDDAKGLEAGGSSVRWLRKQPAIYTAGVTRPDAGTRLEWVVDSDFRFFPAAPDEIFGYVLHPVDLAVNKVMAAAGRREVRDLVDVVTVHETILPLGAVIWAAVEKSPGFTPEGLIAKVRRNASYPAAEWRALVSTEPLAPRVVTARRRAALDDAEAFVTRMPTETFGLLFLLGGKVVQPDPGHLESYQTHAGQRRGQWPSSSEITAAMFERYNQKPSPQLIERAGCKTVFKQDLSGATIKRLVLLRCSKTLEHETRSPCGSWTVAADGESTISSNITFLHVWKFA
jgi:hypothetical protein